jgi:hypothetical protein
MINFTISDRSKIKAYLALVYSIHEVAERIKRSPSTTSSCSYFSSLAEAVNSLVVRTKSFSKH